MLNILYNVAMLAMLYKYAVLPYVEFTHVYPCLPTDDGFGTPFVPFFGWSAGNTLGVPALQRYGRMVVIQLHHCKNDCTDLTPLEIDFKSLRKADPVGHGWHWVGSWWGHSWECQKFCCSPFSVHSISFNSTKHIESYRNFQVSLHNLHMFEMFEVYLAGGLEHFLFFHIIWDNPSHWLSYFQDGWNHQPVYASRRLVFVRFRQEKNLSTGHREVHDRGPLHLPDPFQEGSHGLGESHPVIHPVNFHSSKMAKN